MDKLNGIIYRDENNEKKVGILVGDGTLKPIQLYQSIENGNLLTKEEMIKEGAELYDLGDDTNALSFDAYYRKASVENGVTIITENGFAKKDVSERDILDVVELNAELMEYIIYDNYNLYNVDAMDEFRAFIMEEKNEEGQYASIDEIPDSEVEAEIALADEVSWDDAKVSMESFFSDKAWLIKGTFGSWRGNMDAGAVISSFSELSKAWKDCDYIKLFDVNGIFSIEASHHDGTNYYEVKGLTQEGVDYLDDHYFQNPKEVHDVLWNDDKYTFAPCFAQKVFGVSSLAYKPFSMENVICVLDKAVIGMEDMKGKEDAIFIPEFDVAKLSDKITDLSIFLGNQSYRFNGNVQGIADDIVDLIQPLADGSYNISDIKKAVVGLDMLIKIMENNGFTGQDDFVNEWMKPAKDELAGYVSKKESASHTKIVQGMNVFYIGVDGLKKTGTVVNVTKDNILQVKDKYGNKSEWGMDEVTVIDAKNKKGKDVNKGQKKTDKER